MLLDTQTPLGGSFQAHSRNGAEMQRWLGESQGKTQEGVARCLLPEHEWAAVKSEHAQTTQFTEAGAIVAHPTVRLQHCLWKKCVLPQKKKNAATLVKCLVATHSLHSGTGHELSPHSVALFSLMSNAVIGEEERYWVTLVYSLLAHRPIPK